MTNTRQLQQGIKSQGKASMNEVHLVDQSCLVIVPPLHLSIGYKRNMPRGIRTGFCYPE